MQYVFFYTDLERECSLLVLMSGVRVLRRLLVSSSLMSMEYPAARPLLSRFCVRFRRSGTHLFHLFNKRHQYRKDKTAESMRVGAPSAAHMANSAQTTTRVRLGRPAPAALRARRRARPGTGLGGAL